MKTRIVKSTEAIRKGDWVLLKNHSKGRMTFRKRNFDAYEGWVKLLGSSPSSGHSYWLVKREVKK